MKVTGNIKSNLQRIEQKIQEDGSINEIGDMCRATIVCESNEQLIKAYEEIDGQSWFNITRLKNKLTDPLKLVHINVSYFGILLGEIQIRIGSKPVNFESNHFIYELKRTDTPAQFRQQILMKYTSQVQDGIIDYDGVDGEQGDANYSDWEANFQK